MKKEKVIKVLKERKWLPYVITTVVLAVCTLLAAWARGAFAQVEVKTLKLLSVTESQYRISRWSDAFSISGLLCLFLGISVFIKHGSVVELVILGVKKLVSLFRDDRIDRKYRKYYDENQSYGDKPRPYVFLILVGGAYLLVGILLTVFFDKV